MSRGTISTLQLLQMFPDQETARVYLESRLWPNGAECPACACRDRITTRKGGFYRCNQCKTDFTVRSATIFERSHIPLHKWIYAMYLLVTARKGISSMQLAKEIGVTQKSAWFMLQRLREACGNDPTTLQGIIAVDETHIGGLERDKHSNKKLRTGRGAVGKTTVTGMREQGGCMKAKVVPDRTAETLQKAIKETVAPDSEIHTDQHTGYIGLEDDSYHYRVRHRAGEYVRMGVTAKGIESVWAVLKRGMHGVYHHASPKHLNRYVQEFAFRLNEGDVKRHTLERLDSFIAATSGSRLTYARLTA